MRILYFTRGYTPHDRRFLAAAVEAKHDVFFMRLERDAIPFETRDLPVSVAEVEWNASPSDDGLLSLLPNLANAIDATAPDIIHAGPIPSCAFLAAKVGFHPLVAMSWGSDILVEPHRDASSRAATLFSLRHADWLVCDCDAVRRAVQALTPFPDERIVQLPWGMDLDRYAAPGRRAASRYVLSNRWWASIYGIGTVLESFRIAYQRDPRLRLVLMGDGPLAPDVHAFLARHRLEEVVALPGRVPRAELPAYFREADVDLSCASSDGSSVSLLEAMASGLPVVVTDGPGNREWVTSEGGFLAPAGDPVRFAEALVRVSRLDDPSWHAVSAHNREVATRRADWAKNVGRLLVAYECAASRG